MYLHHRDDTACNQGKQWYVCSGNGMNFRGCCSIDACSQQGCPDTAVPSAASERPNISLVTLTSAPTTLSFTSTTTILNTPSPILASQTPFSSSRELQISPIKDTLPRSATAVPELTAGKSYTPLIAGTVGGLVGASILSIMIWVLLRKRKQRKEVKETAVSPRIEKYNIKHLLDRKPTDDEPLTRSGDDIFAEFGGRYKSPPKLTSATVPPLIPTSHRIVGVPAREMEIRHSPSPAPSEDQPLPDIEKPRLTPPPVSQHPAYHPLPGKSAEIPAYQPGGPAASPPMTQHPAYHISQIAKHPAFRSGPMALSESPPKYTSPSRSMRSNSNSPSLSNGSPTRSLIPRRSSEVREGRHYVDNPLSRRATPPSRRATPTNHQQLRRLTPPNYTFHQLETISSPVIPPPPIGASELPAEVPVSYIMPSPSAIPAPLRLSQRHSSPTLKPITSKFSLNKQNLSPMTPITRGNTEASTYSIPIGLGFTSAPSQEQSTVDNLKTPCATPETPSLPSPAALKPKQHNRNSKDLVLPGYSPDSQHQEQMVGPIGPSLTSPALSLHLLGQASAGVLTTGAKMVRIKEHAHSAPYPLPKPTPELLPFPPPEEPQSQPIRHTHSISLQEPHYFQQSEEKIVYHKNTPSPNPSPRTRPTLLNTPPPSNMHSTSLPDLRPLQALTTSGVPITLERSIITTPNLRRASDELNKKWETELEKRNRIEQNWDHEMAKEKEKALRSSPPWMINEELKNGRMGKEVVGFSPTGAISPNRILPPAMGSNSPGERWSGATMYAPMMNGMDGELMSAVESERGIISFATPQRETSERIVESPTSASVVISPRTPGTALHGLGFTYPHQMENRTTVHHTVSPRTPGTALSSRFPDIHPDSPESPSPQPQEQEQTTPQQTPLSQFTSPNPQPAATPALSHSSSEWSADSSRIDMREALEASIEAHERAAREAQEEIPNLPAMTPLSEISLGSWARASWAAR